MDNYDILINGLPAGFEIRIEKYYEYSRLFKLYKDGVYLCSGYESDKYGDSDKWIISTYAALETKSIVDNIMNNYRLYADRDLKIQQDTFVKEAKERFEAKRLAAIKVLGV
jgi:hypothetical protein